MTTRFVALQHRDFRLIWFGRLLSAIGTQMSFTAVAWQVAQLVGDATLNFSVVDRHYELQQDALALGALGLARVIPIVTFALIGGVLADNFDRRRLMFVTQSVLALVAAILAFLTFSGHISVWVVYGLSIASSAATAFDEPSRQSLIPNLVPREHLTNAVSLNTLLFYTASVVGPAVAGLLIGTFDLGLVYAIDAFSFLAVIVSLALMNYRGNVPAGTNRNIGWSALIEGLRFVHQAKLIWSTMLLDFWATFFSSARTMLPLVAKDILGVGPAGYGLLSTAQAVGAIAAGLILSIRSDIRRQGIVLLVSVIIYGLATALFGLSTLFWLSYLLFAFTGAADTVSTVIRGTIRQLTTPDHLRGRMTSVNMIFFMGGPQLGEMEAGLVASLLGVPFAIFSGGVATILITIWIARQYPRLRHLTLETLPMSS